MKDTINRFRHTMLHPADGFTDFKEQRDNGQILSILIPALYFLARVAQRQMTGFHFNFSQPEKINISFIFLQTVGLFFLWSAANWAVSTLSDGKATFRQIRLFSAVALFPYVLSILLNTLLSNVLLANESMFFSIVNAAGIIWGILVLFSGMSVFHDYSIKEIVLSCVFTLGMILIVIFLGLLSISLFEQVANFINTVFRELMYRI